jgi:hypothetical protein
METIGVLVVRSLREMREPVTTISLAVPVQPELPEPQRTHPALLQSPE